MLRSVTGLLRKESARMSTTRRYTNASDWRGDLGPYPTFPRDESFHETFQSKAKGAVQVKDPYHLLEDPFAETTKDFVKTQSDYTSRFLASCRDRAHLKSSLEQSWSYPKISAPSLKGDGNYYFAYNPGLRAQAATYRIPKSNLDTFGTMTNYDECMFFDPNLLSDDGSVSKSTSSFSLDGKYYAYGLSRGGSDWVTIYVRETSSPHPASGTIDRENDGRLINDVLKHVKFSSIAWLADASGFLYQRMPQPKVDEGDKGKESSVNKDAAIYFHKIGTDQTQDVVVYQNPSEPDWMYGIECTDDGKFAILTVFRDTGRRQKVWIASLQGSDIGNLAWNKVIDEFKAEWSYLANDGDLFYFSTTDGAPKGKIMSIEIQKNERTTLIAEDEAAVLEFAHVADNDKLVLVYTVDVKSKVFIHDLTTGRRVRPLFEDTGKPVIGSVTEVSGRREDSEFFISMSTFTTPTAIWRVGFKSGEIELKLLREVQVGALRPDDFEVSQQFYQSKDGTKVPMFVVKSRAGSDPRPTLLYGYGGFSIALNPFFSPSLLTFAKTYGGCFAVANLRGGSEYGEDWHDAGTKGNKQNVFDDFQAAARYLVSSGVTTHDKLAINGGSNGGLLVGACINQAPELFGAAIAEVGVLDMLRFHRYTIGRLWASDYGCADNPEDFDYLYKYSPLDNIRADVTYPSLLLMTADRDDRVVPAHSLKFGAAIQHARPENANPLLLRIDINSGHGAGKSTAKRIEEAADKYAFLAETMDLKRVQ